jgi:hypothetical protein
MLVMTISELRSEPGSFGLVNTRRQLPTRPPRSVVFIHVSGEDNLTVLLIFGANFEWISEELRQ